MDSKKYRFETLQIHAGLQPDEPTGARGVAIYPTAAYRFKNCDHAARLFELSEGGNIYTRLQNPTTTAYEQRIAALYGAVGALAVSSGMSAILIAVLSLAAEGDNIVASPFLYGGTYNQFRTSLRRLGIDCRIAPSERPEDFEALTDSRTKALYAESMGNPTCAVPDLEALGELARRQGAFRVRPMRERASPRDRCPAAESRTGPWRRPSPSYNHTAALFPPPRKAPPRDTIRHRRSPYPQAGSAGSRPSIPVRRSSPCGRYRRRIPVRKPPRRRPRQANRRLPSR